MLRLSALAVLTAALLGGCAPLEEAYGRPDPFDWTYFEEGTASDVVDALQETFQQSGLRVESIRNEADGVIVTLSSRRGTVDFTEVLVQNTDVEGFTVRAQIYPSRDPLPRWLEMEVSGRI